MNAGNTLANFLYKVYGLLLCDVTVHGVKHVVADVLQGNIKIFANVGTLTNDIEQLQRKLVGVGIMEADPLYALYVGHVVYEQRAQRSQSLR